MTYPLFYISQKRKAFEALKAEIAATGNSTQRLVVYPRAVHFPKKERAHEITFQLVGFDKGQQVKESVSGELLDFEFKLSLLMAIHSRLSHSLRLYLPQLFSRATGLHQTS